VVARGVRRVRSRERRVLHAATAGAIPKIHDGTNTLVCAPTGSGKTQASFCAIINELFKREKASGLENSVYCLYVSPLKSLANDIHRNLEVPLEGIEEIVAERDGDESMGEIRHAIRHGDTSSSDRQKMLTETPHILNTTPETLAILLNSPKFREKLRTVEYVIVDEIHSLAASKRGTHLSVSLERLEAMAACDITRIGCSATIEPLDRVAEFLVGCEESGGDETGRVRDSDGDFRSPTAPPADHASGEGPDRSDRPADSNESESERPGREREDRTETETDVTREPRDYEIVDARFAREFDLQLECPTDDLINTSREVVQERFYRMLHDHVQGHTNTLVFTNTRSGAERVLHNLRERFDAYDEENSGCHHGSLSKEVRQDIEGG